MGGLVFLSHRRDIVGLALVKWVINGDGKLLNQSFYKNLLENVHAAIGSDEPGGPTRGNRRPGLSRFRAGEVEECLRS